MLFDLQLLKLIDVAPSELLAQASLTCYNSIV